MRITHPPPFVFEQRVWEKLMNFALFKVIFIGAILEPSIKELLIWTVWFSIVGFMHLFSFLSKDRFQNVRVVTYNNYLNSSSNH